MPRPGPRPYECVRRAWHSDRHQPIRGSIIQQIFRLVNQFHSPTTRKNREWQEKLPIVVFKAEEIMYSKANSEAEYMDLETIWDRLNDAVDTIIRKEEGMESEGFLQPCIEAALVLGCVPVRGSRSQRNNNPRSYLSHSRVQPPPQEAAAPVPPPPDKSIDKRFISQSSSVAPSNQLCSSPRPAVGNHHPPNLDNRVVPQNSIHHIPICHNDHYPILRPSFDCAGIHPMGSSHSSSSVYPLYHGLNSQQPLESPTRFQWPQQQADPGNVIYGRPVASFSARANFDPSSRNVLHREVGENAAPALYHMQRQQANAIESGEAASPGRSVFHREMGENISRYHMQRQQANAIESGEAASPGSNVFHREIRENVSRYQMQRQQANAIESGEAASPGRNVFHREMGENVSRYHMQRQQANAIEFGEDASPSTTVFHREMGENVSAYHMQRQQTDTMGPRETGGNHPAYHMQPQHPNPIEPSEEASPMDCDLSLRLGLPSSSG